MVVYVVQVGRSWTYFSSSTIIQKNDAVFSPKRRRGARQPDEGEVVGGKTLNLELLEGEGKICVPHTDCYLIRRIFLHCTLTAGMHTMLGVVKRKTGTFTQRSKIQQPFLANSC